MGNRTPKALVAPGTGLGTLWKSLLNTSSATWRRHTDSPNVARIVNSGWRWMRRIRPTSMTTPRTNSTTAASGTLSQWLSPTVCTT